MRLLLIIIMLLEFSCNGPIENNGRNATGDSNQEVSATKRKGNPKYYAIGDTVLIATETNYTLKFGKDHFNQIVADHPEFYQDLTHNPDYFYYAYGAGNDFGSEQGQDVYYSLYAYFLKQRNGVERFVVQRKKLINIYSRINSLFSHLQYGGTFFAHQQVRISGYAEYSVYLYKESNNEFEKTYEIAMQKELYIKSLRQLIEDEIAIDPETKGNDKIERTKKLNTIVDEIGSLITDIFFLRRAQAFHFENYEYY